MKLFCYSFSAQAGSGIDTRAHFDVDAVAYACVDGAAFEYLFWQTVGQDVDITAVATEFHDGFRPVLRLRITVALAL